MMIVLLLKVSAILLTGAIVSACMRRASAASRHVVLTATLVGALLMPIARVVMPTLELRVLTPVTVPVVSYVMPSQPSAPAIDAGADPARLLSRAASIAPLPKDPLGGIPWLSLLVASGVIVLLVRSVTNQRARRRVWSEAVDCPDSRVTWAADRVRALLGLTRRVSTRLAAPRTMPATFGAVSPKLLLPRDAADWSDERLDAVLTHELAHVRRFDDLSHAIARAAAALYWYHPLAWWLARQARLERERACDDAVLRLGMRPSTYAEHLLALREALPLGADVALTMARRAQMAQRLRAILDPRQRRNPHSRLSAVIALIVIAASAVVGAALFTAPVIYRAQKQLLPTASIDTVLPQTPQKVTVAGTWEGQRPIDVPQFVGVNPDGTPEVAPKDGEAYIRYLERATGMPVGADALPPAGLAGTWVGDTKRNAAAIDAGLAASIDNSPMQVTVTGSSVTMLRPQLGRTATYAVGGAETVEEWRGQRLRHRATLRSGMLTVETLGGRDYVRTYWNLKGDELKLETVLVSPTSAASDPDRSTSLYFVRATTQTTTPAQSAQSGPDFSGTWEPVSNEADRLVSLWNVGLAYVRGRFTIAQSADSITVEQTLPTALEAARRALSDVDPARMVFDLWQWKNTNRLEGDELAWQFPQGRPVRFRRVQTGAGVTQVVVKPIPAGQFGAGAYRPGNGVTNPIRASEVKPVYTDAALKAGLQGTVELEAVVGADGTVTDVRVVRSLDDKLGLDENAKDVVRQTPFVPCKIGDTPVACLVVFELQFTPGPPTPIAAGQFGAGAYRVREKAGMQEPIRTKSVSPRYTPDAMRAKIQGTVELEFVVLADGAIGDVRVVKSLDRVFGLDEQAIAAIKATRYTPATLNGIAVPVLVSAELQFTLR